MLDRTLLKSLEICAQTCHMNNKNIKSTLDSAINKISLRDNSNIKGTITS
jgi:hypothetical protein